MAVPTQPTIANLMTEAYKKVGIASPSTDQLTRAETYFFEEVKNDIWIRSGRMGERHLAALENQACQITTDGQSKYSFPTDFDEEAGDLEFLDGDHADTVGAASTGDNSITFASDEDAAEADVVGKYIILTGGTGVSTPGTTLGIRQARTYSTSTKVALVDANWATNPSTDTTYRIINKITKLQKENVKDKGFLGNTSLYESSTPSAYTKVTEDGSKKFILDTNPDASTYGIYYRYYVNLMKTDTAGSLHNNLLYNWRGALTSGVAWKIAEDEDDDKYQVFKQEYEKEVQFLLEKESPGEDEFEGFEL